MIEAAKFSSFFFVSETAGVRKKNEFVSLVLLPTKLQSRRYNQQLLQRKRGNRFQGQAPTLLLNAIFPANLRASNAFSIEEECERGAHRTEGYDAPSE